MNLFSSLKILKPTVLLGRLLVASAGIGAFGIALYRTPDWLETWSTAVVVAAILVAGMLVILAIGVALRGSATVVKRAATEIVFLGCSLILAEAVILGRSPEAWSENPKVQRMIAQMRAASGQRIAYDARLRSDVVRQLRSEGDDAIPGAAQSMASHPAVLAAIRDRGLLPLANASNAYVVECNEGLGYLQFRSDALGFNNPAGLVNGHVKIAVIGESLALGHCVPPTKSAVDLVRKQYPCTANFGVAGSRVLSQLAIFREYVEPLKPSLVVWFVNTGYAEPEEEAHHPILSSYLDPSFSQRLRERQNAVDSFAREILVPLSLEEDEILRVEVERSSRLPIERVFKLREIRRLVDYGEDSQRILPVNDLSYFKRALDLVTDAARTWGGKVIVVMLPTYANSTKQPSSLAQYAAVQDVLSTSGLSVVDGISLFAAQQDFLGLYTLRVDSHPNARGHALLADAVIATIEREGL